jgi:hypothetical protein
MAKATKSPKPPNKAQLTPKGKANGQAPPPPASETVVQPDGTIERYAHGQLVKTTPPPQANGKPPAKAKAPKPQAAPKGPPPSQPYFVARLGTDDIWEIAPLSEKPGAPVMVRHYEGYTLLREQRYTATLADKLYRDLLTAGFVYIDGVTHRLVDEDA